MITDEGNVLALVVGQHCYQDALSRSRTPFINGTKLAGSVDMDASSMKTTGKSATLRTADAALMHVVQTTSAASRISRKTCCSIRKIFDVSACKTRCLAKIA